VEENEDRRVGRAVEPVDVDEVPVRRVEALAAERKGTPAQEGYKVCTWLPGSQNGDRYASSTP